MRIFNVWVWDSYKKQCIHPFFHKNNPSLRINGTMQNLRTMSFTMYSLFYWEHFKNKIKNTEAQIGEILRSLGQNQLVLIKKEVICFGHRKVRIIIITLVSVIRTASYANTYVGICCNFFVTLLYFRNIVHFFIKTVLFKLGV